jgi:N-acetylglucosaminyldiphosphoundecaprenol N-acetyl-beta-D-mannosaminyltransferase
LAADEIPVALVGSRPKVAMRAAENWQARIPFELLGAWDGYRSPEEYDSIANHIAASAPCVLLLGLGSPAQERLGRQLIANHQGVVVMTVGGLFDFVAGIQPRAPLAWREAGVEWVWRLLHEPRRLGRRYLLGNPMFLGRVLKQRFLQGPG